MDNPLQIIMQPPVVALSGSPLLFTVSSDSVQEFYKIMALPFHDDPAAGGDLLSRNSLNQATFDLHEYFAGTRKSEFGQDPILIHNNHCKPATIRFKEFYGNPPEEFNPLDVTINIMGGSIPRWKQHEFRSLYSSFNDYHLQVKPFLTWYPRTYKKILPDQPERLYFLNRNAQQTLKIMIGVYFDDASFVLHDPQRSTIVNQYQVVSWATGFNALGLAAWAAVNHPGKKIKHYYIAVATAAGNGIGESFLYTVDYKNYRNIRYLIFQNSLFGFDVLPCTGESDITADVERSTASRIADVNDRGKLHKLEYFREASEFVKINTGWLHAEEKRWLSDLLISNEIWEVSNNQLNRILLRTKQLDLTDRSFSPGDVELEYERLFFAE